MQIVLCAIDIAGRAEFVKHGSKSITKTQSLIKFKRLISNKGMHTTTLNLYIVANADENVLYMYYCIE